MTDTSNITDNTLINLGFSLGAFGHTWRIDGYDGKDWYYIQAVPSDSHGLSYRLYGSTDAEGQWELLDRGIVQEGEELKALVKSTFEQKLTRYSSLVRPDRPMIFRLDNPQRYVTI